MMHSGASSAFLLLITGDGESTIDADCLRGWVKNIRCLHDALTGQEDVSEGRQIFFACSLDSSVIELLAKEEDRSELTDSILSKESCWLKNPDIGFFLRCLADKFSKISENCQNSSLCNDSSNHMDKTAKKLHKLVDMLPGQEGYLLVETFWIMQRGTLPLSLLIPVYGVLKRLQEWHNSKISILHHSFPPQINFLNHWSNTLSFSCVDVKEKNELIDAGVLWHGRIVINKTDQDGMESGIFPGFSLACPTSSSSLSNELNVDTTQSFMQTFYKKDCTCADLQILDMISKESVPLYEILPLKLRLTLPSHPVKSSKKFMEGFLDKDSSKDLAMLACFSKGEIHEPRDYSAWTKYICADRCKETIVSYEQNVCKDLPLLLICAADDNKSFSVYLLRSCLSVKTNLDSYLAAISVCHKLSSNSPAEIEDFVKNVPLLPVDIFLQRHKDLITAELKELESFAGKDFSYQDIVMKLCKVVSDIERSHKTDPSWFKHSIEPVVLSYHKSEIESDPKHWMERLHLRHLDSSERWAVPATATLGGLPVPVLKKQKVPLLDAKDILEYFHEGNASVQGKMEVVKTRKSELGRTLNSTLDNAKSAKYPDALDHKFHGIEYCLDTEDVLKRDKQTSTLLACYISSETSSMCIPGKVAQSQNPDGKQIKCNEETVKRNTTSKRKVVQSAAQNKLSTGINSTTVQGTKKRKRKRKSSETQGGSRELKLSEEHESTTVAPQNQPGQETRSQRHMRRLQVVVDHSLKSYGVTRDHPCYQNCSERLLLLCKSFLKDLKTSEGLNDEMKRLAKSNVRQVVKFEMRRHKQKEKMKSKE